MSALIWDELSDDEAAQLREEYRSELPKRLDRFLDSLPREVRSQVDQSFGSLDVVWQWWVGSHAPPDDLEEENVFLARDLPLWARSTHGLARKIGATNAHAVTDLAAYVASTITAQHPEAIWTTDPDLRSLNANQPLLFRDGHGKAFFPDANVGTLCYRALIEPSDGRNDPRDASALRRMVALLCGHNSDPTTARPDEQLPSVVVCRPTPSMPRRTYLVLLDEDLARDSQGLVEGLREHLDADATVTGVERNDERSFIVTIKRFSSDETLHRNATVFVESFLAR